jgi:hypothetical protein
MDNSMSEVFSNPFGEVSYMASNQNRTEQRLTASSKQDFTGEIAEAGRATIEKMHSEKLPSEVDAKRQALLGDIEKSVSSDAADLERIADSSVVDQIYSLRAEFSGFIFSLVDSAPSEIAVASLRNFNALSRWNALRTSDASLIVSIGWLQVDNHIPSAPFKVAVRPDTRAYHPDDEGGSSGGTEMGEKVASPLLVTALAFAPKHKSGIVVSDTGGDCIWMSSIFEFWH